MSIAAANKECVKRIQESTATLVDIRKARDVVPGMGDRSVFHAGPPVVWERMCGPMKGAIAGACLFEGWVTSLEDAEALAAGGELHFDSLHNHRACGPMSGITTPSMTVNVIRNDGQASRRTAICTRLSARSCVTGPTRRTCWTGSAG